MEKLWSVGGYGGVPNQDLRLPDPRGLWRDPAVGLGVGAGVGVPATPFGQDLRRFELRVCRARSPLVYFRRIQLASEGKERLGKVSLPRASPPPRRSPARVPTLEARAARVPTDGSTVRRFWRASLPVRLPSALGRHHKKKVKGWPLPPSRIHRSSRSPRSSDRCC